MKKSLPLLFFVFQVMTFAILILSGCQNLKKNEALNFKSPTQSESSRLQLFVKLYPQYQNKKLTDFETFESPYMIFRSHVKFFYLNQNEWLKQYASPQIFLFGDLHVDNFGYFMIDGAPLYVFNDFDDSNQGPLFFDVVRYFTSMQLKLNNQKLTEDYITLYFKLLQSQEKISPYSDYNKEKAITELIQKNFKNLKKFTKNNKFILDKQSNLSALENKKYQDLKKLLEGLTSFNNLEILDLAFYSKKSGGSANNDRYWILTRDEYNHSEIFELKQIQSSALNENSETELFQNFKARSNQALGAFFKITPYEFDFLNFENKNFILRSRKKTDYDFDKLSQDEIREILNVQTTILAAHHKNQLLKKNLSPLTFFNDSIPLAIAKRVSEESDSYQKLYQDSK